MWWGDTSIDLDEIHEYDEYGRDRSLWYYGGGDGNGDGGRYDERVPAMGTRPVWVVTNRYRSDPPEREVGMTAIMMQGQEVGCVCV
jgi:hypothetical protein